MTALLLYLLNAVRRYFADIKRLGDEIDAENRDVNPNTPWGEEIIFRNMVAGHFALIPALAQAVRGKE